MEKMNYLHGGHVKDTLKIFLPEKHYLSPAQGACLANGSLLQNLYNFGATDSAVAIACDHVLNSGSLYQFVRELFHQNVFGEPLLLTHNKSKPAFFLTPGRIGHWIGLDESNLLSNENARDKLFRVRYSWTTS